MKKLLYIFLALLLVLFIVVGVAYTFLDSIVKNSINSYAPKVLGIPVSVADVSLQPLKGHFEVKGFKISNPVAYKSPDLLKLENITVDLDMKSLFSQKIVVKSVEVSKPEITYEMLSLTTNNISEFLKSLNKIAAEEEEAVEEEKEAEAEGKATEAPAKSVVIDMFNLAGGNIAAVMNVAGNLNSVEVAMPTITMNNLGEKKSQTLPETVINILTTVLQKAMQVVVSSNVMDLKQVANDNMNGIIDTVKEKVGLFGLFGKKEEAEEKAE